MKYDDGIALVALLVAAVFVAALSCVVVRPEPVPTDPMQRWLLTLPPIPPEPPCGNGLEVQGA